MVVQLFDIYQMTGTAAALGPSGLQRLGDDDFLDAAVATATPPVVQIPSVCEPKDEKFPYAKSSAESEEI